MIICIDDHVADISVAQKLSSEVEVSHQKSQQDQDPPTPERNAVLKASLDALVRAGAMKKGSVLESGPLKKKGVLLPAKPQVGHFR